MTKRKMISATQRDMIVAAVKNTSESQARIALRFNVSIATVNKLAHAAGYAPLLHAKGVKVEAAVWSGGVRLPSDHAITKMSIEDDSMAQRGSASLLKRQLETGQFENLEAVLIKLRKAAA